MKTFGIFVVLAALALGATAFAAPAPKQPPLPPVVYKITLHQVFPEKDEHSLICKSGKKRCRLALPVESHSPAKAVDVIVHADPDNVCMMFVVGEVMLEPGNVCFRNGARRWVRLSFPVVKRKRHEKPAPGAEHPFVANLIVTLGPPHTAHDSKQVGERG